MANETIVTNSALNYVTYLSKTLTQQITDFLIKNRWNVTVRWVSLLTFFISILIFYIGIKVAQPFLKWILILGGLILVLGLLIPFW